MKLSDIVRGMLAPVERFLPDVSTVRDDRGKAIGVIVGDIGFAFWREPAKAKLRRVG